MVRATAASHVLSTQGSPLQYLDHPYPDCIIDMLSCLPPGLQALAYQNKGVSLDFMTYWARNIGIVPRIRSNELEPNDLNFDTPLHDVVGHLRSILDRTDAQCVSFERLMCLTDLVQLSSMYYRKIVVSSSAFQAFRKEATNIAQTYLPKTQAERDGLVYYSMMLINSWKTSAVLEPEGIRLLDSLKMRFPEYRRWESLAAVLEKFPWIGPIRVEWEESWHQSCRHQGVSGSDLGAAMLQVY